MMLVILPMKDEAKRKRLEKLVSKSSSLHDPDLVTESQKVDELIVRAMRKQLNARGVAV